MSLAEYVKGSPGRGAQLARQIGVNPVLISQWIAGKRGVPARHRPAIERATGGAVTVEQLGDDVAWVRIFDPTWPHVAGRPCMDVTAVPEASNAQ